MSRTKGKAPRPRHGTRSGTETLPLIPPAPARPVTDGGEADPVFVDSSGRRARRIRRVGYTAAGLCAAYTAVLALSLLNARAVTVYLWHEVALVLAVLLVDRMWQVPALENSLPLGATWLLYLVAWPLIAVAVLLVGWAEDRAARRPPRLWPWPAPKQPSSAPA